MASLASARTLKGGSIARVDFFIATPPFAPGHCSAGGASDTLRRLFQAPVRFSTLAPILLWSAALGPTPLPAQNPPPALSGGQAASIGAAGAVLIASLIAGDRTPHVTCAPCDPRTIPGIDRWALTPVNPALDAMSDFALAGLGLASLAETFRVADDRAGFVTIETAAWAVSLTQLTKVLLGRKRPVLYGDGAGAASLVPDSYQSMPSGHAAAAFAAAAAFWLNTPDDYSTEAKLAAFTAATGVAVLRVTAGKHFPSDVAVGAAVGTLTAIVIHHVRY